MAQQTRLAKPEPSEIERIEPWNSFREMERMFRDFFNGPLGMVRPRRWWPPEMRAEFAPDVDLKETETEFIMTATVPGMTKDDIEIDVTKDAITISGERRSEEEKPGEHYHLRQQTFGCFNVCYGLPADVKPEEVKASHHNGVLEVRMPKAEVIAAHKVKVEERE